MVGYRPNESMTPNQKLIAGCMSGAMTRFVTQPLDVVKLRVQLTKKKKRHIFKTTARIFSEEGFPAFFQGHGLGQIHAVLAVSSQFYVYELSTKFVAGVVENENYRPFFNFLCGIFAGCTSAAIVNPMEVIRVRQMILSAQYKGLFNGAKQVYKTGGILAFYGGLTASLLQMGPAVGISFGVFNLIQPLILSYMHDCDGHDCNRARANEHRPEVLAFASSVAGSTAGLVSKTATYPFDLAKRRLQIGSHIRKKGIVAPSTSRNLIKCSNLTDCLMQTFKKEGFFGLFRGWKVTIMKAQVTSVVAFTSYEMFCFVFREINNQ